MFKTSHCNLLSATGAWNPRRIRNPTARSTSQQRLLRPIALFCTPILQHGSACFICVSNFDCNQFSSGFLLNVRVCWFSVRVCVIAKFKDRFIKNLGLTNVNQKQLSRTNKENEKQQTTPEKNF